jgi:hypothetical protein
MVMQAGLRPYIHPWVIFHGASMNQPKKVKMCFLTAKLGFTGSTIRAVIPAEFRLLLDFARDERVFQKCD